MGFFLVASACSTGKKIPNSADIRFLLQGDVCRQFPHRECKDCTGTSYARFHEMTPIYSG